MFEVSTYKDIFNARAASYHEAMSRWPNARDNEFQALFSFGDLSPKGVILDFPSGGGYLSRYFSEGDNLIHVETSEVFARLSGLTSSHLSVATTEKSLPVLDESINVVMCLAGLHHEKDKDSIFKEFCRVLKPGGVAVIADVEDGSCVSQFLDVFVDEYCPMGHNGLYFSERTSSQIEQCGFSVLSNKITSVPWLFANENDMAVFCKALFGIDNASVEQVEKGIQNYLGVNITDEGGVALPWALRYIVAKKEE